MRELALMFHGKFHCIKTINVRKKNIVQMIKFWAIASSGTRKVFCVVMYIRKNWYKVKCVKSTRMEQNLSEV